MSYFNVKHGDDNYAVIAKTLENYFGCKVEVGLHGEKCSGSRFLCFERVNGAFTKKAAKRATKFLISDVCGKSLSRRVIVRAYITASRFFPGILKAKAFLTEKPIANADSLLIYPANKKIKLFDFQSGTITNLTKCGYGREWFDNEIATRKSPAWEFIPPLTVNKDGSYTEDIISGTPVARLAEKDKIMRELENDIALMQSCDNEIIDSHEYAINLGERLDACILRLYGVPSDMIDKLVAIKNELMEVITKQVSIDVQLCFSHGDLQWGNILYEEKSGKLFIIDWETAAKRSAWFDLLIMYYGMRDMVCFADSVAFADKDGFANVKKYLPDAKFTTAEIIPLFLMEDMLWHTQEITLIPADNQKSFYEYYLGKLADAWEAYKSL